MDSPQRDWMSQNPAHAHRRALSPPAVTRFQLITPAAAETVFAPPYVPARSERLRYTRKVPEPLTYAQFPEPFVRRPPPAPPPSPPPPEPVREPSDSWREIIARIAGEPEEPKREAAHVEEVPAEPVAPEPPVEESREPELVPPVEPAPPEAEIEEEPPSSWELDAFTTEDYTAPRVEEADEIPELVLDDVVAAASDSAARDLEAVVTGGREDFPLDAFIVPAGAPPPSGYESDVAQKVAHRLDELARQLRSDGLAALGDAAGIDELSRVLAAVVTGYIARDA